MLLIVGLGNPGERYARTRHNVGFCVVDRLFATTPNAVWQERFLGALSLVAVDGRRAALLKPMTYMNESGRSVAQAAAFYKVAPSDILVAHDELDLPLGGLRLKRGGGEAGHRGLLSISRHLGTQDYLRLRFGIGKPPADFRGDTADYVLEAFAPSEDAQVADALHRASAAVVLVANKGLEQAMTETNRSVRPQGGDRKRDRDRQD